MMLRSVSARPPSGPTLAEWCANGRLEPGTVPLSRALIDAICHDHPFAIPWPHLHWPQ
jgi:hypothetical protein